MECFKQGEVEKFIIEKKIEKQQKEWQRLRNLAYEWTEKTRPNLGTKASKSHIKAIILMWNMDLLLNRKTPKQFANDVEELTRKK